MRHKIPFPYRLLQEIELTRGRPYRKITVFDFLCVIGIFGGFVFGFALARYHFEYGMLAALSVGAAGLLVGYLATSIILPVTYRLLRGLVSLGFVASPEFTSREGSLRDGHDAV